MKKVSKFAATGLLAGGALALTSSPAWAALPAAQPTHAVFVESDNSVANTVSSYTAGPDGALSLYGTFQTGGLGGQLTGSVVDHQASQGALLYDADDNLLFVTNAGSDSISVFSVRGVSLDLVQTISSGGSFPVSIDRHGNKVYVLNARDGGSISGFTIKGGRLVPISNSTTGLGFTPESGSAEFTHTPGQITFSPDGSELLVTTKALGQSVLVYSVGHKGVIDPTPTVNAIGGVPFALSFTSGHQLELVEAAGNVATFNLDRSGNLTQLDSVATGQAASCWIAPAAQYAYVSNAGSSTVTGFSSGPGGSLTDLGNTATDKGTVDAAASSDGNFLYVRAGLNGLVDTYQIGADGSLTPAGTPVSVPGGAGGEGIATS